MEGPLNPQHPGHDAGAAQPEAQDGDLHALLERLLGQGDVRPSAPGAGDDLWPDLFAAAPAADEVSTIVPAPDAPAAVADLPTAIDEPVTASVEPAPARAWEPVVVDARVEHDQRRRHPRGHPGQRVRRHPADRAGRGRRDSAGPVVVEPAAIAPEPLLDLDLNFPISPPPSPSRRRTWTSTSGRQPPTAPRWSTL